MIDRKYYQFQKDLQKGLRIDEALSNHQLTLLDAFNTLHQIPMKHKKQIISENKYLLIRKQSVQVRKKINGKWECYGSYKKIGDARKLRDHLIEHDWKVNDLDKLCEELDLERAKPHRGRY